MRRGCDVAPPVERASPSPREKAPMTAAQPRKASRQAGAAASPSPALPPATNVSLDIASLEGLLGFRLRMAQLALYRDFSVTLAELDLTQKQCAILQIVGANPGVSQVD